MTLTTFTVSPEGGRVGFNYFRREEKGPAFQTAEGYQVPVKGIKKCNALMVLVMHYRRLSIL